MTKDSDSKEELIENIDPELQLKKAKKKKIIIAISIAAILICAAIYFFLVKKSSDEDIQTPKAQAHSQNPHPQTPAVIEDVYYDLDNFVINLNSSGGRSRFLKMTVTLHIKSDVDVNIISKKIPIIRDNFQFYLRELRPSDLEGSKEMMIVKEELMIRINKILSPIIVQDILFKEILVN